MKEVKITHYNNDNTETTVPISGRNIHELNTNINNFMNRAGWSKKHTDITAEKDELTGKWYSR